MSEKKYLTSENSPQIPFPQAQWEADEIIQKIVEGSDLISPRVKIYYSDNSNRLLLNTYPFVVLIADKDDTKGSIAHEVGHALLLVNNINYLDYVQIHGRNISAVNYLINKKSFHPDEVGAALQELLYYQIHSELVASYVGFMYSEELLPEHLRSYLGDRKPNLYEVAGVDIAVTKARLGKLKRFYNFENINEEIEVLAEFLIACAHMHPTVLGYLLAKSGYSNIEDLIKVETLEINKACRIAFDEPFDERMVQVFLNEIG